MEHPGADLSHNPTYNLKASMKPRNPLSPGRTSTLQERRPPAAHTSNPTASNDNCEDGCFFCTGPETD